MQEFERFTLADALKFERHPAGLWRAVMVTPRSRAVVYPFGGHIAEFELTGHPPILYMSSKSKLDGSKAIRGGVPIIFPWFGQRADNAAAPQHGFARTTEWTVESTSRQGEDIVRLVLRLDSTDATRKSWPLEFTARLTVDLGQNLVMRLAVQNRSSQSFSFEEALHTYLTIGDINTARITGLANTTYIDKVDGFKKKTQDAQPVQISGETDRVYVNTQSTCVVEDPTLRRRLIIEKSGSNSTVLWNPWADKAKGMSDVAPDDWKKMLCVETTNAADNTINLPPGSTHEMSARLLAELQ